MTTDGKGLRQKLALLAGPLNDRVQTAFLSQVITSYPSKRVISSFKATACAGFAFLATGCVTGGSYSVVGAEEVRVVEERVALKNAAAALSETPWPKPSNVSLVAFMSEGVDALQPAVSREDVVDLYLDNLLESDEPLSVLMGHAEVTLGAAEDLALAAEIALVEIKPRMSDVAVLEKAIQQLRECRTVFLKSIEKLPSELSTQQGVEELGLAELGLKGRFDAMTIRIGGIADEFADLAAGDSLQAKVPSIMVADSRDVEF